jgi:uncharacterized protein
MKASYYNFFTEQGKSVICYNSLSTGMMVIPATFYRKYSSVSNIEELKNENETVYEAMLNNGFIIDDERNELAELRVGNKAAVFGDKTYHLTVLPTLDCNLKCWYCFEKHVPDSKMEQGMIDRIIKNIELRFENEEINNVQLDWFGGEPLLYFDENVYPLAMRLKNILEERKKRFSTFFVTNIVAVTDEMIPKLKEINPSFQITLDGDKQKHDKIRCRKKDKTGTYEHIINMIHKLTEEIDTFIIIRINYDNQTLEHIENIIEDLIDIDRQKVKIHLERVWQTRAKDSEFSSTINNTINLLLANDFRVSYLNFNRKAYSCMAEKLNRAAISYDGKVYRCTGRNFTDELSEGILNEDGEIIWDFNKVVKRLEKPTFENPMCLPCKMLPICMGPCSQKILEKEPSKIHEVCALNSMEITMDEFIRYLYNNEMITQKIMSDTLQ